MRSVQVRRWRLVAAFVLLTYVVLHFLNPSLGLVSVATMEAGRWWFLALWRSAPGTVALYGALTVHGVLAQLDASGFTGDLAVSNLREGRVEVVPTWGRPESVRREFAQRRAQ